MFARSDSDLPFVRWNAEAEGWGTALPGDVPAPGLAQLPHPLIATTEYGRHISYDILGLAYWMLTRQEEVGRTDLDAFGRFPAAVSHAHKHAYLNRPIVDEWLELLRRVMLKVWSNLSFKRPQYRVLVSHDVDNPARYGFATPKRFLRSIAGDVFRRRDVMAALKAPALYFVGRKRLHPADPLNTFEWLMDRSDENGIKSAFYFICGRTDAVRDALYSVDHPAIRKLIRRIYDRGHEVGLHPSFNTYCDKAAIASEAATLKKVCTEEGVTQDSWGGRMHYLRWKQPETMQAWAEVGLDYDSTLGYPEQPGFRCGTCHEYQGFDPVAEQVVRLRIRPLVAMDVSVISSQYMGLGYSDTASAAFLEISNACKAVGGVFTLLWHNCQLEGQIDKSFYTKVLSDSLVAREAR